MKKDDWRPLISEQISAKKIIMTLENTHLATDIQGDNKLYAFEWPDMPDIIDRS